MPTDQYRDDFNSASIASVWTVTGSWAQASGRLGLSETGATESTADNSTELGKGDIEVAATVNLGTNARVGLQVLLRSGNGPGYEFAVARSGSTVTGYIYRLDSSRGRTEVASGSLTASFGSNRGYRLKGRLRRGGYERADIPVALSLYFDDEDTAELTYTDRYVGAGMGAGFVAISGQKADTSGGDCAIYIDSFQARRLTQGELPETWAVPLWTWARLRDQALARLESFGNPQMTAAQMLEFLGFAEQELVHRCGMPYWLDRVYELSATSLTSTLPAWIAYVVDAIDETNSRHIPIITRAEFNFREPGRDSSGDPMKLVFAGLNDYGQCQYYAYPAPSSTTLTLYVKGKPGHIQDADAVPLTPPQFVEALVVGALRRALIYDEDHAGKWQMNERLWNDAVKEIVRDNMRVTKANARLVGQREADRIHSGAGRWSGGTPAYWQGRYGYGRS